MNRRWVPVLGLWASVWAAPAVWAHGVMVDYRVTPKAVELEANFDTGEPMANAQVTIYAPDQAAQPWLTTTTDASGHATFSLPIDQKGNWQVKIRQAGHGKILNIPVDQAGSQTVAAKPVDPAIRSVMSVVVIGGLVLTAILFSRRKQ